MIIIFFRTRKDWETTIRRVSKRHQQKKIGEEAYRTGYPSNRGMAAIKYLIPLFLFLEGSMKGKVTEVGGGHNPNLGKERE